MGVISDLLQVTFLGSFSGPLAAYNVIVWVLKNLVSLSPTEASTNLPVPLCDFPPCRTSFQGFRPPYASYMHDL